MRILFLKKKLNAPVSRYSEYGPCTHQSRLFNTKLTHSPHYLQHIPVRAMSLTAKDPLAFRSKWYMWILCFLDIKLEFLDYSMYWPFLMSQVWFVFQCRRFCKPVLFCIITTTATITITIIIWCRHLYVTVCSESPVLLSGTLHNREFKLSYDSSDSDPSTNGFTDSKDAPIM